MSSSAVVFLGCRLSRRVATQRYPYGWECAEDLAGLGVALVIGASAAFAGVESIHKLLSDQGTSHVGAGIAAAAASIIGNQWQMNTVTTKPATGSAQGLPEGDADEPGQRASGGESIRPRVPGIADQGGGLDAATNPQLVPGYHLAVLVTQTTA